MNQQFIQHVEELKALLDSFSNPAVMKTRLEKIEALLATPKDAPGPKVDRNEIMGQTSFMIKNKERIDKAVGLDKYMDVFSRAVKFLEQNPPERKKKKLKKSDNPFLAMNMEANPFTGYFADPPYNYTITYDPNYGGTVEGPTATPAPAIPQTLEEAVTFTHQADTYNPYATTGPATAAATPREQPAQAAQRGAQQAAQQAAQQQQAQRAAQQVMQNPPPADGAVTDATVAAQYVNDLTRYLEETRELMLGTPTYQWFETRPTGQPPAAPPVEPPTIHHIVAPARRRGRRHG